MKTTIRTATLAVLLLGSMIIASPAAAMDHHHPGDAVAMCDKAMNDMMMDNMTPCARDGGLCSKPCMKTPSHHDRHQRSWRKDGMSGLGRDRMPLRSRMIQHRMDHLFLIDRAEELGLTVDQVSRLKALRAASRKERINQVAEAKIARLELQDLLEESNWTPKDAEPLIRPIQKLQGDLQMLHLQVIADVRKVLSAEQLEKADKAGTSDELEELFK